MSCAWFCRRTEELRREAREVVKFIWICIYIYIYIFMYMVILRYLALIRSSVLFWSITDLKLIPFEFLCSHTFAAIFL